MFVQKISDETRALVRFLKMENKYSLREIAKKVKISKSSVARCLKIRVRIREKQILDDKKFSVRDRRLLIRRSIDQLRQVNANFIIKELIRFSGLQCSGASHGTNLKPE